ncbi:MAG: Ppx/GppA phosphatase family protein [Balneolaceae bacterium]|nr:Ppx/GppA phosphatase family protein [Balneolaceae bacterium]
MKYAAVDIGTNTVLLLIAEYDGAVLTVLHEEQRIPRLGRGVDASRKLSTESMNRVIEALVEYRTIIERDFPAVKQTVVTATSAVRDASNRAEFRRLTSNKTGYDLKILSGREEAVWTYRGATTVLDLADSISVMTLDIGGGSSEISLGTGNELLDYYSYNIGSVRFTERFFHHDPPRNQEVTRCRNAIDDALEQHIFSPGNETTAIGIAGTVTSLAYMQAGLASYDPRRLNGMIMTRTQVSRWIDYLSDTPIREIIARYPLVMEGRGDIFLAGVLILERFMQRYNFDQFTVSTGGIRHGAICHCHSTSKEG